MQHQTAKQKSYAPQTPTDHEINALIAQEQTRQATSINLIASENYVSAAVLHATASVLTNKYAEGYPGKRYYAGCQFIDQVEQLAIDRCKQLFNAPHANVQPHAGSQANMAVYQTVLNPGDTILGMSLSAGGHLTHGHGVNFSGKLYRSVQYTVNRDTELLDFNEIRTLAHHHKPKLIIAGASAYSRIIDFAQFAAIAKEVGAILMTDIAHIAGLVAAKVHPNPFPHADFVSSTTHKTLRGPRGGLVMCTQQYADQLDKTIIPGMQGGPLMHSIAAKAVAFHEALQPAFTNYQRTIVANAQTMAQEFKNRGYRIVADGTDNHLFIVDLKTHNITGLEAEQVLDSVGITLSRSCIPFDTQKPWITSGIRIGTPAITTRGFDKEAVLTVVDLIDTVIKNKNNGAVLAGVKSAGADLCRYYAPDLQ